MFITKSEYDLLVKKANGNVKSDKEEKLEAELKSLREDFDKLVREGERKDEDHKREVSNLKEDSNILLERKDAEIETKIAKDTQALNELINELTIKKNNAEQKVEILETAFKNLGFDVKDMKSILNKLVDGLIAKNQIQLIKSN